MERKKRKCPFRPLTYGNVDRCYGNGCPSEWHQTVYDFDDCLEEKCMLYDKESCQCKRKE